VQTGSPVPVVQSAREHELEAVTQLQRVRTLACVLLVVRPLTDKRGQEEIAQMRRSLEALQAARVQPPPPPAQQQHQQRQQPYDGRAAGVFAVSLSALSCVAVR
jgi:hypothetical protein